MSYYIKFWLGSWVRRCLRVLPPPPRSPSVWMDLCWLLGAFSSGCSSRSPSPSVTLTLVPKLPLYGPVFVTNIKLSLSVTFIFTKPFSLSAVKALIGQKPVSPQVDGDRLEWPVQLDMWRYLPKGLRYFIESEPSSNPKIIVDILKNIFNVSCHCKNDKMVRLIFRAIKT